MAKGTYRLDNLSPEEHKAALAAVKLVRVKDNENAYREGWRDGWNECSKAFRGERVCSDGWETSHAKALSESKVQTPPPAANEQKGGE